jgi:hypothetical protein
MFIQTRFLKGKTFTVLIVSIDGKDLGFEVVDSKEFRRLSEFNPSAIHHQVINLVTLTLKAYYDNGLSDSDLLPG